MSAYDNCRYPRGGWYAVSNLLESFKPFVHILLLLLFPIDGVGMLRRAVHLLEDGCA
jgi:hypothetical protein